MNNTGRCVRDFRSYRTARKGLKSSSSSTYWDPNEDSLPFEMFHDVDWYDGKRGFREKFFERLVKRAVERAHRSGNG